MVDHPSSTEVELRETPRVKREVTVPVFIKVTLPAGDDMEAEAAAVAVVRSLAPLNFGEACVEFQSVLVPSCKPL